MVDVKRYKDINVQELKTELGQRNLVSAGSKAKLVKLLIEHDKTINVVASGPSSTLLTPRDGTQDRDQVATEYSKALQDLRSTEQVKIDIKRARLQKANANFKFAQDKARSAKNNLAEAEAALKEEWSARLMQDISSVSNENEQTSS